MHLNNQILIELHSIALEAARKAGETIRSYSGKNVTVENKMDLTEDKTSVGETLSSQVVTEVDHLSEKLILEFLEPTLQKYDLALLTEETEDSRERLEKDYFWCIDPMDGTLFFTENEYGYSVAIALIAKDGTPQIGVVYEPVNDIMYHAIKGCGAYKNNKAWSIAGHDTKINEQLTIFADKSYSSQANRHKIETELNVFAQQQSLKGIAIYQNGGAVLNALWMLENSNSCYFKFPKKATGGGSLWDFAASACIASEYGAICTNIYGKPLDLNRTDSTFMNHGGVIFTKDKHTAEFLQNLYQRYL